MKAVVCTEWGTPDQLEVGELPAPQLKANQILIEVHACGVNFADTLMIKGEYQERPEFPFAPGLEVSGVVRERGNQVTRFEVGDRVMALCGHGGYAEAVTVVATAAIRIPDEMDFATAAGFAVTYGTAHVGLSRRANLIGGEMLLVHGAGGGVGLAAVEVGKQLGGTVIATAATEEKLALAAAAGADHTINYRQSVFRDLVKELTNNRGVDVVFDPVGGEVFRESLRCLTWEGRILAVGFASGEIPKIGVNLALVKNISIVGLYWGAYARHNPLVMTHSWSTLLGWYKEAKLKPRTPKVYPLEQTTAALNSLLRREAAGKLVVQVREG